MHWNFPLNAVQILWILTFAAHLVLLVVLLGRERTRRFPFFTASIAIATLMLLTTKLLYGRVPQLTMGEIYFSLADISSIIGLLVVVEMARRAFASVRQLSWLVAATCLAAVGAAVLYYWGPWPQWKTVLTNSLMAHLGLMQLAAQKVMLFTDVLTIGLGILVVLLGRKFGAGWHSHVQRIVAGLMTASISQLTLQGSWQSIAHSAVPHSQAEYERLMGLHDKLLNANNSVYVGVLIWWIACLWKQEPGSTASTGENIPTAPAADRTA
jgi:hypothetical protein